MTFMDAEARTTALVLEDARRRLVRDQGRVLDAMSKAGRTAVGSASEVERWGRSRTVKAWLDESKPLDSVVWAAMHSHGLPPENEENADLARTLMASLKMRVLAGTYAIPVYTEDPGEHCGSCARMFYDEEVGGDRCEVPDNQELADAWHAAHGFGPACPFWQRPDGGESLTVGEERIEELFGSSEYDEREMKER